MGRGKLNFVILYFIFFVMDWNLKAPSWDLVDHVDKATTLQQNIGTKEEQNRFGVYRMKGEFSVDLKLGHHHVGNSGTESALANKSKDAAAASGAAASAGVSKMASSPSGSSKRARTISSTSLTVSCLVDGCNSDLSNCRDYHRRHKVCELHSKTPEVTIAGLKQRFCQQCSRFASYHIVSFFFIMLMVSFLLVGGIEHVTFLFFFLTTQPIL